MILPYKALVESTIVAYKKRLSEIDSKLNAGGRTYELHEEQENLRVNRKLLGYYLSGDDLLSVSYKFDSYSVVGSKGVLYPFRVNETINPFPLPRHYLEAWESLFTYSAAGQSDPNEQSKPCLLYYALRDLVGNIEIFNHSIRAVSISKSVDNGVPFELSDDKGVLIHGGSSLGDIAQLISGKITNLVTDRPLPERQYSTTYNLDVLLYDASISIGAYSDLGAYIQRYIESNVVDLTLLECCKFNDHLYRLTVTDRDNTFEDYCILRLVKFPRYDVMLQKRASKLLSQLDHVTRHNNSFLSGINEQALKADLGKVIRASGEINLQYYVSTKILLANEKDGPRAVFFYYVLSPILNIFAAHNHYLESIRPPIDPNSCLEQEIHSAIFNAIAKVATRKSYYLVDGHEHKKDSEKFRDEPHLSKTISDFIDMRSNLITADEIGCDGGRIDIGIRKKNDPETLQIIEVKLIRKFSDIAKQTNLGVSQLSRYSSKTNARVMLLMLALDVDLDELIKRFEEEYAEQITIDSKSEANKKFLIRHFTAVNYKLIPIRFASLYSTSPSKDKLGSIKVKMNPISEFVKKANMAINS